MKTLKNLRIQFGNRSSYERKNIHKHSIYMQSKDSTWLNRNLTQEKYDGDEIQAQEEEENKQ